MINLFLNNYYINTNNLIEDLHNSNSSNMNLNHWDSKHDENYYEKIHTLKLEDSAKGLSNN